MDKKSSIGKLASQADRASSQRRTILRGGAAFALLPAAGFLRTAFAQTAQAAAATNYNTTIPSWVPTLKSDLAAMATQLDKTVLPWKAPAVALYSRPENHGYTTSSTPKQTAMAIQASIDYVHAKGGGVCHLEKGDYVSGTIVLKDNVQLLIDPGVRLVASTDKADYPQKTSSTQTVMDTYYKEFYSLIYAEGATNISIAGKGTIYGQGEKFPRANNEFDTVFRPFVMRIIGCTDIHVTDVTMINSPAWMHDYLACDNLLVENITVSNISNINNDAIDIDGCQNVIVRNCDFNSEDDGICFKGASERLMQNVLVENCDSHSSTNALKIGTDTQGSFNNILVRNCLLSGPKTDRTALYKQLSINTDPKRVKGGISWESTDGGTVSNILVSDCQITNAESPFFIALGDRNREMPGQKTPPAGTVRRIVFDQITGSNNGSDGSWFSGLTSKPITDVVLSNVDLGVIAYTGKAPSASSIGEIGAGYPDPGASPLPAYGLWGRHITNLTLSNCSWTVTGGTDTRPKILIEAS